MCQLHNFSSSDNLKEEKNEDSTTEIVKRNNNEQPKADCRRMVNDSARNMEKRNDRSDIRMFEEGLDTSYNEYSNNSERDRRTEESQRLVNIAKRNGLFIPFSETKLLGDKHPKRTGESVVYINEDINKVFKVKDPYAKSSLKNGVQPEDVAFEHLCA